MIPRFCNLLIRVAIIPQLRKRSNRIVILSFFTQCHCPLVLIIRDNPRHHKPAHYTRNQHHQHKSDRQSLIFPLFCFSFLLFRVLALLTPLLGLLPQLLHVAVAVQPLARQHPNCLFPLEAEVSFFSFLHCLHSIIVDGFANILRVLQALLRPLLCILVARNLPKLLGERFQIRRIRQIRHSDFHSSPACFFVNCLLPRLFRQHKALLGALLFSLDLPKHRRRDFQRTFAHIARVVVRRHLRQRVPDALVARQVPRRVLLRTVIGGFAAFRQAIRPVGLQRVVHLRAAAAPDRHRTGAVNRQFVAVLLHPRPDARHVTRVRLLLCRRRKANRLLPVAAHVHAVIQRAKVALLAAARFSAHLAHVGLGALRVNVQHAVVVFARARGVAVLQEQRGTLEQARHTRRIVFRRCSLHAHPLRRARRLLHHLLNPAQQVLHEADFAHVLTLQHRQFFRQVVRIHAAIARNQQPLVVVLHQRQIAAPLVFHPHGVKVLRLAADNDHHLRAVQRREDVRLVLLTQLVLQRDAAEEHLQSLLGQPIIDILRPLAVARPLTVLVRLLVADEHVIRFFVGRNRQNSLLDFRNPCCFLLIDAATLFVRRVLHRREIILVRQNRRHLHAMARRDSLMRCRIFNVLNAESADDRAPVRLGIRVVLLQNFLVRRNRLVELALPPEVIRAVVAVQLVLVLRLRNRRRAAAVLARPVCCARNEVNVPAAHFTLDNHGVPPLLITSPEMA